MYSAQPKKMDYFRAISVLYPKLEDCIMVLLPNLLNSGFRFCNILELNHTNHVIPTLFCKKKIPFHFLLKWDLRFIRLLPFQSAAVFDFLVNLRKFRVLLSNDLLRSATILRLVCNENCSSRPSRSNKLPHF